MLRRELMLRMAHGEVLTSSDMQRTFFLGKNVSHRDQVRPEIISQLIEEGLVKADQDEQRVSIVLTDKANLWFQKRHIPLKLRSTKN